MKYKAEFLNFYVVLLNFAVISLFEDVNLMTYVGLYACGVGCVLGVLGKVYVQRNDLVRELAE